MDTYVETVVSQQIRVNFKSYTHIVLKKFRVNSMYVNRTFVFVAVLDGVVYRGMKIVVPSSMRPAMLQLIHGSHLGIM